MHDAVMQHLYSAFWVDRVLSWTSMCYCPNYSEVLSLALDDTNDAFRLAQSYFLTHQYSGAERLLSRPFPIPIDVPDSPVQVRD